MDVDQKPGGGDGAARFLAVSAFLTGFFPPLSIGAANVALALFLVAAVAARLAGRESLRPAATVFDVPLAVFMGVWALAALFGLDPSKSLGKAVSQSRFILFYLLIWTGGGRYRLSALKGYLWGAGTAVAYGLFQAAAAACVPPAAAAALSPSWRYYLFTHAGRVHGAVHPLTFAEVILPLVFFCAAYFLEARERRSLLRGAGSLLVVLAALLLTQSRGPWLGAAAGLGLLFAFHPRRLRLIAPLALAALGAVASPSLRSRAATLSLEPGRVDGSQSHRVILWNNAWQVARRHWLTGVGAGNLKKAVERHREEPGFLPNPMGQDGDAHNQYLHHLAERGVGGLAALLFLLGTFLAAAARSLREAPSKGDPPPWVLWGVLAFSAAFLVANVTERVFDDAEPALVFWILAALLPAAWKGRSGRAAVKGET